MKLLAFLLISSACFGMGSKKPKWYDGPADRKATMVGWIDHAIACMPAPSFKKEKVRIKYIPIKGIKKFSSGWAYQASDGAWVHGETFLNSQTQFDVKVATTPDGKWDKDANETEGHEIGHVVAYNQFLDGSHNRKWTKCFAGWMHKETFERIYDEKGNVVFDTSHKEGL